MLAEEMVRIAIAHLPARKFTEHRLLEINFKSSDSEPIRDVEVWGCILVHESGYTEHCSTDSYRFKAKMRVRMNIGDHWAPEHIDFHLIDWNTGGEIAILQGGCRYTWGPGMPPLTLES
jgi:hypothetical protein